MDYQEPPDQQVEVVREESLSEIFARVLENTAPAPYSLDVRAAADLSSIYTDPNYLDSVSNGGDVIISVSKADLDNLDPEFLETFSIIIAGLYESASDYELARQIDMNSVSLRDLELALEGQAYVSFDNMMALRQDLPAMMYSLGFSALPVKSATIETPSLRQTVSSLEPIVGHQDISTTAHLYVPAPDFDHENLLNYLVPDYLSGVTRDMPGTSEQWAALIAYHEGEHLADDGQKPLHDYYWQHKDAFELDSSCAVLMKEIEADCAAFMAMGDDLSPEVAEYWIAARLVSTLEYDLRLVDPDNVTSGSTHSTGFHLAEFYHTGAMRDYFDMQSQVNGFYSSLCEYGSSRTESFSFEQKEAFDTDDFAVRLDWLLALTQEAMADGAFTPEQEHLAQQLVYSLDQTLGVEASQDWVGELQEDLQAKVETNNSRLANPPAQALEDMASEMLDDINEPGQAKPPGPPELGTI